MIGERGQELAPSLQMELTQIDQRRRRAFGATKQNIDALARLLLSLVPAPPAEPSVAGARSTPDAQLGGEQEPARDRAAHTDVDAGESELAEHMVFTPSGAGRGYSVERVGPNTFVVNGRGVERLLARYDIDNEDALAYLEERLRKIGVIGALEDAGFEPGDELHIAGVPFELDPRTR